MKISKIIIGLSVFCILLFVGGCKCVKKNTKMKIENSQEQPVSAVSQQDEVSYRGVANAVAPTIVYKTKKDYRDKVPVTLSNDKTEIVAYPDPIDIYYNGELAYPTELADGYLLDNRGINKNVAFTDYTYEEYANLEKVPTKRELMQHIIDANPLIEIIDLGARSKYLDNEIEAINTIIKNNFVGYKRVKPYPTIVNK